RVAALQGELAQIPVGALTRRVLGEHRLRLPEEPRRLVIATRAECCHTLSHGGGESAVAGSCGRAQIRRIAAEPERLHDREPAAESLTQVLVERGIELRGGGA